MLICLYYVIKLCDRINYILLSFNNIKNLRKYIIHNDFITMYSLHNHRIYR